MLKYILLLVAFSTHVHGENLIRMLIDGYKNSSKKPDMSKTHQGINRVNLGSFYYYKLKPKQIAEPEPPPEHEYDLEAIAEALEYQNQKHPDNEPLEDKINTTPETTEPAKVAEVNDKQTIYGEASPLQDESVLAAWKRAEQAKRRLDEHRDYMERVRKSKKTIEQSKLTTASVNQTGE